MAENVAPPREPPSPKFRSLRKAAAKVTGVSHAFSRRPKDQAAAPWEQPDAACDPADDEAAAATREAGQHKRAKFPTSKAPISAVFHSFRLILGRAIISRNGLEAWMLFPERARAEHSR